MILENTYGWVNNDGKMFTFEWTIPLITECQTNKSNQNSAAVTLCHLGSNASDAISAREMCLKPSNQSFSVIMMLLICLLFCEANTWRLFTVYERILLKGCAPSRWKASHEIQPDKNLAEMFTVINAVSDVIIPGEAFGFHEPQCHSYSRHTRRDLGSFEMCNTIPLPAGHLHNGCCLRMCLSNGSNS